MVWLLQTENGNSILPFVCCQQKRKKEVCFPWTETIIVNRLFLFQQTWINSICSAPLLLKWELLCGSNLARTWYTRQGGGGLLLSWTYCMWCLDVQPTPHLDTVTLQTAHSEIETVCPNNVKLCVTRPQKWKDSSATPKLLSTTPKSGPKHSL